MIPGLHPVIGAILSTLAFVFFVLGAMPERANTDNVTISRTLHLMSAGFAYWALMHAIAYWSAT